jgi:hypothetical protein
MGLKRSFVPTSVYIVCFLTHTFCIDDKTMRYCYKYFEDILRTYAVEAYYISYQEYL